MTPGGHEGVTGVTFDSDGHRRLHARAGQPCRCVEVDGASHPFSWHRGQLRDLIVGWLDQTDI
jgi:hypothetical protein